MDRKNIKILNKYNAILFKPQQYDKEKLNQK